MSTPFESLDDAFNISSEKEEVVDIVPTEKKELEKVEPTNKEEDREKDYQYARGQLYNIIDKMQEALNGAMDVAQESDHPRAFEVVFQGAKHTADVLDKLQDLQKKQKDITKEDVSAGDVNNGTVNNVYMTGTTADLMKMLKEAQQDDK